MARMIAVLSLASMVASMLPPLAPVIAPVEEAKAATRLGIYFTQEELDIWRQRSVSGPYRIAGDTGIANTPGDWTRIESNKNWFMTGSNHLAMGTGDSASIWGGYTGSGCVPIENSSLSPTNAAKRLRDAALWSRVREAGTGADPTAAAAVAIRVRDSLMNQVSQSGTDFSNTSKWCITGGSSVIVGGRHPTFVASEWLTRVIFTYDYIKHTMSASNRATFETWLSHAGNYFMVNVRDLVIQTNYGSQANFFAGTLSQTGAYNGTTFNPECCVSNSVGLTHVGGYRMSFLQENLNNRQSHMIMAVTMAGFILNNDTYKNYGKSWAKEIVKYGIYPDGTPGELFRSWQDSWNGTTHLINRAEEQGPSYSTSIIFESILIADAFARQGDNSIYEFTTPIGISDTAGGSKNLKLGAKWYIDTYNGTKIQYRYGFSQTANNLINGVWANEGIGYDVWDIYTAFGNGYWKDQNFRSSYLTPGPVDLQGQNIRLSDYSWMGPGQIFPGIMFMYANMADDPNKNLNPYV